MKKLLPKTKMFAEAAAQSKGKNFIIETLIFIAVFLVTSIVSSLGSLVYGIAQIMSNEKMIDAVMQFNKGEISQEEYQQIIAPVLSGSEAILIQLFSTGISTLLVFLFVTKIEKRKLSTMGFRKSNWGIEYLCGMGIGTLMFSLGILICVVTGSLRFEGLVKGANYALIFGIFIGFLIQGMSEEVILRGYYMVSVSRKNHIAVAVGLSSAAFGLAHLANPNVNVLPIVNITLFGLFEAIYIMKRGNIWGACGIHSLWNFVQGSVFGVHVSGLDNMETIFSTRSVASRALINGGDFGLEGGLAVTIVLILATVITLMTKTKESEIYVEESESLAEQIVTAE